MTCEPFNAPRSGHWTVASTVNGSGIDDRVPTVHGAPPILRDGESGQVKRIDGDVLRRLAVATEQEKKVQEEQKKAASVADPRENQAAAKVEKEKNGFYVPRLEGELHSTFSTPKSNMLQTRAVFALQAAPAARR